MAFLTERMPRMLLMIILFPMISLGLCAWMTVFGFYIKLEEKEWARLDQKTIMYKEILPEKQGKVGKVKVLKS